MTSWQIVRILFNVSDAAEGPLYDFERARPPRWWATADHLISNSPRLALVLTCAICYLCTTLTRHVGPLVLLITLLPFAGVIIISLNIAPIIAQERERHTWELLRAAPLDIEVLLLSKVAGRLWWLRDSLRAIFGLLVVIAVFLSCASTVLPPPPHPTDKVCWGTLIIGMLSMALILADRVQQFVLIVVTSLAAGSSFPSARNALTASASAIFVIWIVDLIIAALVISHARLDFYILAEQILLASWIGPVAAYIVTLPPAQGLVYAGLTILIREILVRLFWRYTVWAARSI